MGIDVQCGPRGLKGAGDSLFHSNGDGTFSEASKKAGVDDPNGYYGLTTMWSDFNNTGRLDIMLPTTLLPAFFIATMAMESLPTSAWNQAPLLAKTATNKQVWAWPSATTITPVAPRSPSPIFPWITRRSTATTETGIFKMSSYPAGIGLPSLPYVKWGIAFVDLDNDGWLDLVTVNGHVYPQVDTLASGTRYREPKLVQFNQGNGTFCDASDQSGPAILLPEVSRGLAVGDLFNDGNMDLVIGNLEGSPRILRNPGIPGQHWVSFELAGTKSNRMAIGARVKIIAGGVTQTQEIYSGGSYLSQHDTRVHFGLAKATKIDSVEIRWPSGKTETLQNLDANHFYAILEGQGIVPPEKIRPAPVNSPN